MLRTAYFTISEFILLAQMLSFIIADFILESHIHNNASYMVASAIRAGLIVRTGRVRT